MQKSFNIIVILILL